MTTEDQRIAATRRARKPGLFESRVGRKVFFVFVTCALLPLSTLALFTYRSISQEFTERATEQLRQSGKFAGLSTLERLYSLESDVAIFRSALAEAAQPNELSDVLEDNRPRLENRLEAASLIAPDGLRIDLFGEPVAIPEFAQDESDHMEAGRMLIKSRAGNTPTGDILATVRILRGGQPLTFVGMIRTDSLWDPSTLDAASAELIVLDSASNVLFSSDPRAILAGPALGRVAGAASGEFEWNHDDTPLLAGYWTLFMRPTFYPSWIFVYSQNKDEVLAPAREFGYVFGLVVLLSFWIVLFLSVRQIRRTMTPVEQLTAASERLAARDLSVRVDIQTNDEFRDLGRTFNRMTSNLETHIKNLGTMNEVGLALSDSEDMKALLETVMLGTRRMLNADGACIYTVDDDGAPQLAKVRVESMSEIPGLFRLTANQGLLSIRRVQAGETVNVGDIYSTEDPEFAGFRTFDLEAGYRTTSFLGIPLRNHERDVVGMLQLFNRRDVQSGEVVPFSPEDQAVVESLASGTGVALAKHQLLEHFRNLFEALTELIAKAIDEKSPYTGEHCKRVPILSMMLADAVCRTREGPFAAFSFTDDELYELRIAALLHDCGKVTTPVHIMDKATKLETIIDRILLIETRFEVVRRDREIALLKAALGGQQTENIDQQLREYEQDIVEDLEFLKRCNTGGEGMLPEHQERVIAIAERYRWRPGGNETENVLSADEVRNLTIFKGTLTDEEREIINQHVVTTMKLLDDLPYPKNLRNVPVYAGAHHERMDGRGYPFGLTKDQIALQGRIIGIADVFEALTASDRPYKKGKDLSETLDILASMAQQGHVDPELFETLIREKVYLRYAEEYVDPAQIDPVDEAALIEASMPGG